MTNSANLDAFAQAIVIPGLQHLERLGGPRYTPEAARFVMAIALQESGAEHRFQQTGTIGTAGPARSFWQFERGGVAGVMKHQASARLARKVCDDAMVEFEPAAIWRAIEGHDHLACAFARLLILTSPKPLPMTPEQGWEQYAHDLWRPGKPHPGKWPECWKQSHARTVGAG